MVSFAAARALAVGSKFARYAPTVTASKRGFEDDTHWAVILEPPPLTGLPTPLVDKQTGEVSGLVLPADMDKFSRMRPCSMGSAR